ncbi:uncharacterized protein LOC128242101 isoform X2 [Mya arenaria]|uniref:uncharacterized protein LOC128242101 isoform X2 n=1 Tax=Mya arenaria TaxID=6604 RepID=UPI0022E7C9AA|nr:uncharacterized protein LOC128242101 isoform X2 [Mya arenaria]
MNPLNCVVVTILYCLGEIWKGQGIFISQCETHWGHSKCSLEEPNITCKDDGVCILENGLELLQNIDVPVNGLWIGFAKTWISYAYVGCNNISIEDDISVSTLGECRRTTGCRTFGIRNSTTGLRCTCADNIITKRLNKCIEKCEEVDEYPCGRATDTNIFSIYTVENVPPSTYAQDKDKNCLVFKHQGPGQDYHWESCQLCSTPALLCSDKKYSNEKQMAKIHYNSDGKWAKAVSNCFKLKPRKTPATIKSITKATFTGLNAPSFWTGISKKESIISSNYSLDNSTNPPVTYAYVVRINQTTYVRFANKNDSKKGLCTSVSDDTMEIPSMTARDIQTTLSESTTPDKDGTMETPSITTRDPQPTISESTTSDKDGTMETPSITTREPQPTISESTTSDNGTMVSLAAGLSVSLVLLIVVTIIMLLFLKRSGLLPKCYKQNDEHNNHAEDTTTEISFVSPIFESTPNKMNALTATNHSYFVLEKTFHGETKEETDHYAEPDTTDVDHYDLTETSQKYSATTDGKNGSAKFGLAKPNSNYSNVTFHETDEYDHIHQNRGHPKSARQMENAYDISTHVIGGKRKHNFGDDSDTYNHLNIRDLESSVTDNVYGWSETDDNSGYTCTT